MPPRATRKKSTPTSARTRKSTLKSEELDVESTLVDQNNAGSELENKGEELAAAEDEEGQQVAHPVTTGEEIKQETGVIETNSTEVEGFPGGGEKNVAVSSAVELKIKEEAVEDESNAEGVTGNHINVNREHLTLGSAQEREERMEAVESEGGQEIDNANMEDETEECENPAEMKRVEVEQNEGSYVGTEGTQLGIVPVADKISFEEGKSAAEIIDVEALGASDNVLVLVDGGNERDGKYEDNDRDSDDDNKVDNEDEKRFSEFIYDHMTDRKKEKEFEIYIGNLHKGAVEDDLIDVFGKFGEIRSIRVARNPSTNKSRGFAFIQYSTLEQTRNALSQLESEIQVRGKRVKISASQDKDTLYLGNICKLWTKERVLGALKSYGVENIVQIHLPDDPQNEGKIKGFALLEFNTHSDALAAFQRLRNPDALFGRDRSAKVSFAQTPMHPTEEITSQVKTVYVEGLSDAWSDEKIKEICSQYGEVVKVILSRSLGTKRKDFGFISFTSRESALACVDGVNNSQIGEGEAKVKASIAKPRFTGRLQKSTRGGFKVNKNAVQTTKEESQRDNKAEVSKMKAHAKSKRMKKKGKMVAEDKGKAPSEPEFRRGKPNKPQTSTEGQRIQASSKVERSDQKRKNRHSKAKGRREGAEHGHNEKPSKKPWGNAQGRQSNNFRKSKADTHKGKGKNFDADFVRYSNPYAPGYAASAASYHSHAHNTMSGSKRPYADMEPHAGYIEPVARKQGRRNSVPAGLQYQPQVGYLESAAGTQGQLRAGYHEPAVGKHGRPRAGYLEPSLGTHGPPHAGYVEPAVGGQGRSYAGHFESAVGNQSHNPYDLGSRRAGGRDLHGSSHSTYGAGSSLQPSYVAYHPSYAGYEVGSSRVGGHYQSSGAQLLRRAYY